MAHQIEVSPEEVEAADASGNVDAIVRSVCRRSEAPAKLTCPKLKIPPPSEAVLPAIDPPRQQAIM